MDLDPILIRSNPFFKFLDESDFTKLLDHTTILSLPTKQVLFHEGDFSDAFYIVKEGAIQITTVTASKDVIILARIAANGFFGEHSFSPASSPRRKATATAQMDTILYKFPRDILLSLNHDSSPFQTLLKEHGSLYIKEKLEKLTNSFQAFSLKNLMKHEEQYPKRSVIFYQGEKANRAHILVQGEVELRRYNAEKQIEQITSIGPGQIFGLEALETNKAYTANAVTRLNSTVIVIDAEQYNQMTKKEPLLNNLKDHFNRQFTFKTKGKMIQFRSEYLEMPATTSIISLNDKREVICQQVSSGDIFLASITNESNMQVLKVKYTRDDHFYREISLINNKIVNLLDSGIWEDSHTLLDLMIDEVELTNNQLQAFSATGHFNIEEKSGTEDLICKCMRISRDTINQLIAKKFDLNEISKQTGAGTVCGSCRPTLLEMLGTNAWMPCSLTKIVEHNADVKSFQLTPLNQKITPFKPGQYLIVKAKIGNVWVQRSYTLTSSPDRPYFEITVKKEQFGVFSQWLFSQSNSCNMIYVAGPYGQFTLAEEISAPIVCFMGGIGITPAIAFLRYLTSLNTKQKIYIDYSVLNAQQFILKDEFSSITEKYSNVLINYRITSIHGLLTSHEVQSIISSIQDCHVYLCGPKGLEKLIIDSFNQMNLTSDRLHVEQFIHAGAPENLTQTIELK